MLFLNDNYNTIVTPYDDTLILKMKRVKPIYQSRPILVRKVERFEFASFKATTVHLKIQQIYQYQSTTKVDWYPGAKLSNFST